MELFKKQKSSQIFQDNFKSDSSGILKNSGSLDRKRETIIHTYEEPVLPKLAKILFISMLVLTVVMVAVDFKNGFLYIEQFGLVRILCNLSQTAATIWLIYTALLTLVCGIGMRRNFTTVRRKASEGSFGDLTQEDISLYTRSARRLNKPLRVYLLCCLIGSIVWIVLYIITHYFM